jgi:hypothetical protein
MTPEDERELDVFAARLNVTAIEVLPRGMRDSPVYRHMVAEGIVRD